MIVIIINPAYVPNRQEWKMNEKEMNKPTRPTNRQNRNKTRDKGLLVGWMTRAVVHGDASTLGMAGLDFTRMLIFLR